MTDETLNSNEDEQVTTSTAESAPAEKPAAAQSEGQEAKASEATWWWDDKTPGVGDKPDWLDAKYKSVRDQAKGLPGIRKILGEHDGAPEEYEVNISDDLKSSGLEVDKDDPLIQEFTKLAKDTNMSQRAYDKIVNMYLKNYHQSLPSQEEIEAAYKEEFKEAGGAEKVKELAQWGENNLPEDMLEAFKNSVTDAASAKLFMYVRDKLISKDTVPVGEHSEKRTTPDELKAMWNDPRALRDPEFQKQIQDKYKSVYGK